MRHGNFQRCPGCYGDPPSSGSVICRGLQGQCGGGAALLEGISQGNSSG